MSVTYYLKIDDQKSGPFHPGEVRKLAAAGQITCDDLISIDGESNWVKAGNVKGLFPSSETTPIVATLVSAGDVKGQCPLEAAPSPENSPELGVEKPGSRSLTEWSNTLFDKVKTTGGAISETVKDSYAVGLEKMKTAGAAISDTIKDAYAGGVAAVKDAYTGGVASVAGMVADIGSASGDLHRVGFAITDIEIQVAVPPVVIVKLAKERDATDEQFAAAIANNADKLTARTLLKMAQQADRWMAKIKLVGRQCRLVNVKLGVPTGVSLVYSRQFLEPVSGGPSHQRISSEPPVTVNLQDAQVETS